MIKRVHYTLIKADHKLGKNKYVQGRVTASIDMFAYGIDRKTIRHANSYVYDRLLHTGSVIVTICTKRQYKKAAKYVEQMYPGLCVFDYTPRGKESK